MFSLGVIVAWWVYEIWRTAASPFVVPDRFSQLVFDIAIRKLLVVIAIGIMLRIDGGGLRDLGFVSSRWATHMLRGFWLGVVVFVVINVGLSTLISLLVPRSISGAAGSLTKFFHDPARLLAWIPIGVIGGGFAEELERVFVLTRFERLGGPPGLTIGLVLSSFVFGVTHLYQGTGAALTATVSGAMFGLVYLRRRSGLEAAACHAFADVLGVVAATLLAS